MSAQTKILVVEDEAAIQELLRFSLTVAGFDVVLVESAEQALAEINSELPAVVLLDLMLPGMSGVNLAKRLRTHDRTRRLPIIMVTARADEEDRVGGLDIGADDYVTKPFSPKELIARIRAVLRRRAPEHGVEPVEVGAVCLDPGEHVVTCRGKEVSLGPTEFILLKFLMTHPDRVFSRDQLLDALRGDHSFLEERTIDVYIRRLRAGLGEDGMTLIETVRGTGYKLVAPKK